MNKNYLLDRSNLNRLIRKVEYIVLVFITIIAFLCGTVEGVDVNTSKIDDIMSLTDEDWSNLTDKQLDEIEKNMKAFMNNNAMVGGGNNPYTKKASDILDKVRTQKANRNKGNESEDELLGYNAEQIQKWLWNHNPSDLSQKVKDDWRQKINNSNNGDEWINMVIARLDGMDIQDANKISGGEIYVLPKNTSEQSSTVNGLQSIFDNASVFESMGSGSVYDETALQDFSKSLYNILLSIGVAVSVIIGMTLGIKFTMAGVDEKADIKKHLLIYVAGCVIVFGAFAIWKLAVNVFAQI